MGSQVFEEVARQHLVRFAARYDLPAVADIGRWWGRKGELEIDLVARLADGTHLFGEVKWASSPVSLREAYELEHKVEAPPHSEWRRGARLALLTAGEFCQHLIDYARESNSLLVDGSGLYPKQ